MAGKYCTLAVKADYLKDVSGTGTAPLVTSTELARAESFAQAVIDRVFSEYARGGWDATVAGQTTPYEINDIALLVGSAIIQRLRNVKANFDYTEESSLASRLRALADSRVKEIKDSGCVALADGTLQRPAKGGGVFPMTISRATADAIESDQNLRQFAFEVGLENSFKNGVRSANVGAPAWIW